MKGIDVEKGKDPKEKARAKNRLMLVLSHIVISVIIIVALRHLLLKEEDVPYLHSRM